MPKKGPDIKNLNRIKNILKKYPQGLWVREIAKKTKLDKSMVSRYINLYLKDKIKDVYKTKKPFRIIKLR
jgi:DNA invertase Pin-like site-specific DNA recombinase